MAISKSRKTKSNLQKNLKSGLVKKSNRPGYNGEESREEDDQTSLLAALEKHQAQFLSTALPGASFVSLQKFPQKNFEKSEEDTDDLISEQNSQDDSEDDSEEFEQESAPEENVIDFCEPTAERLEINKNEMRNFMNSKIKNVHYKPSVADLANTKKRRKVATASAIDVEQEAHLESLDAELSTFIRPLTNSSGTTDSQLSSLISSLPLEESKPRKGHTALPKNAPRTLRRGQEAANLKRAKLRDEAAGILPGAKVGREALTLKEKRKLDGTDKRQRGMTGAYGKMTKNGLVLSKKEIAEVNGLSKKSSMKMGKSKRN